MPGGQVWRKGQAAIGSAQKSPPHHSVEAATVDPPARAPPALAAPHAFQTAP